jgi:hypothetical protein
MASIGLLDRLVALVPPPETPVGVVPWASIEGELGLELPHDYKAMAETYGAGTFFDGLWLPGPDGLVAFVSDYAKTMSELRADGIEHLANEAVHPEPGCLVPWAHSDGYYLMWRTVGPPDAWASFGGEGSDEDPWPGSATESVLAYATGGTDRFWSHPPEGDPADRWHDGRPIRNWFEPDWRRSSLMRATFGDDGRPFLEWLGAAEALFIDFVPLIFRDDADRGYQRGRFAAAACRVDVCRRGGSIECSFVVEPDNRDELDRLLEGYVHRVGLDPVAAPTRLD